LALASTPDPHHIESFDSVSISRPVISGGDACVVLVDANNQCVHATPHAYLIAQSLTQTSHLAPQRMEASVLALTEEARQKDALVTGTIYLHDGTFERTYDLTLVPVTPNSDDDNNPSAGWIMISALDVTLSTSMRRTLVESRQRYKDLVEISAAFAWETNAEGKLVFVSPQGVLGYSINDLIGKHPETFLAEPLDGESNLPFTSQVPVEDSEVWLRRSDGSTVCLLVSALPLFDDNQTWTGVRGICRDITDVRERDIAIARARNRERLLSFIVRSFRDEVDPENMLGIATTTVAQGVGVSGCTILRMSSSNDTQPAPLSKDSFSSSASFGRMGNEDDLNAVLQAFFAGQDVVELILGDWNILAAVTRYRLGINGAIILWRELSRVPYDDDDRILLSDLSAQVGIAIEQISNHEHILDLSRTDSLTGLFNRRAFIEEMERRTARLHHEQKPAALIYVDLDNFKMVNDLHGHLRGDEALLEVKRLLIAATRPTDLIARLGGDEFALWMDGADKDIAIGKAKRLLESSASLDVFSGSVDRPLSMSLGIAIYDPNTEENIDALLSRADGAMYLSKHSGKGSYRVAVPASDKSTE